MTGPRAADPAGGGRPLPERSASDTTGGGSGPVYAGTGSRFYPIMLAALAVIIVLSGIGGSKAVRFGPVLTDGAFFIFPFSYILGDSITELYGPRAARQAIATGFVVNVLSSAVYWVIIVLPGLSDEYGTARDAAFRMALGPVWQVVLAGVVGFAGGQSANSFLMWLGKRRHHEKGLYGRLASSTGAGEFIDTLLFCLIAAHAIGLTGPGRLVNYTVVGYLYKIALQYALMPVTGRVIKTIKRHEPSYQAGLCSRGRGRALP
ncbi:queuosine precursor transporter [uncultured Propionibacterium sp.]|uniref:queuosine precursor transporter n=1 Tax=uncultured Propionibacterium sp. TaxID=218066 RepID=UPI00293006EF|nr:queuosine precursor transporter [uncultured Propionibacterium sp.]